MRASGTVFEASTAVEMPQLVPNSKADLGENAETKRAKKSASSGGIGPLAAGMGGWNSGAFTHSAGVSPKSANAVSAEMVFTGGTQRREYTRAFNPDI